MAEDKPRSARPSKQPGHATVPPKDGPNKLLVVDDRSPWMGGIAALVRDSGYAMVVLDWPGNISEQIDLHEPDLLLLPSDLAGSSGVELVSDLRMTDGGRRCPIMVVVTQDARYPELVEQCLRAGADDVLRMTMLSGEMLARIDVQIRNKRFRDALRDVRRQRDDLRVVASTDALTGVLNRRALEEYLAAEFARRNMFSILVVDVDHFKRVNDRFGHDVGDFVLKEVTGFLRRQARGGDACGRFGGEEFVVALRECNSDAAFRVAERYRRGIAALPFPKGKFPPSVTVSIGVATFEPTDPDKELIGLFRRADAALYRAKRLGRNRVIVAPPPKRESSLPPADSKSERPSHSVISQETRRNTSRILQQVEASLVKHLNTGRAALPMLPTVAAAATRLMRDPSINIAHLAQLVEHDPHIAARFLAVANSALYRGTQPITSPRQAIVRMGLTEARELLSRLVHSSAIPRYQELVQRTTDRALLAGRASRLICRIMRHPYDYDYLCGLLHDLGEARILRILAGVPEAPEDGTMLDDLVMRYHTKAGAQLAETWNLASDVVEACASHHDLSVAKKLRPARIAMLSDVVVRVHQRPENEPVAPEDVELWKELGLNDAQLEQVRIQMRNFRDLI